MSRYLVTGGCGFIGSSVVNCLLERNEQVFVLDNLSLGKNHWSAAKRRPTLLVQDILDFDACDRAFGEIRPDTVIHLAAHHFIPYCEEHAYEAYVLNVHGTLNMLEHARRHQVPRFFLASSGDVYHPNFVPHREVDPVGPVYVYGHTKMLAEQVCIRYFESKKCFQTMLIGRLFNAAGPRETNPHMLAEVTRQIAQDRRMEVEVGNLWPLRDYIDSESMAAVIIDATAAVEGLEILNFGSGNAVEVSEALRILTSVLPFKVNVKSVAARQRPNDRPFLCPDVARLRRTIGRAAESFDARTARKIFAEYPGLLEPSAPAAAPALKSGETR
jgi:UDP-glucose 4-epimerase